MKPNSEEALSLFNSERYSEAFPLLKKLAETGVPEALGALGCAYQLGLGVKRDGQQALHFLEQAVALGDGASAHNLGTVYVTGLPGIAPSHEMSKHYYRLAKSLGFKVAPDEFYE